MTGAMKLKAPSRSFDSALARHGRGCDLCPVLLHNLESTRNKIKEVSSRIPYYQGSLTVHDLNHVDALWEMVDLLLYDDEKQFSELNLNPLELYILGTAILVHDVGLSAVALAGGLDELRKFPDFEPTVRNLLRTKLRREPTTRDISQYDLAREGVPDGVVGALLRSNHAAISGELVTRGWSFSDGQRRFLIENDELREDWAATIGALARSHNEDVKELRRLPEVESIRAGHRVDWTVRPQFLACILRCADILQIDHRRAPRLIVENTDFQGPSQIHWRAQSKIKTITADEHLIRVFSTDFNGDESDIWWQGYEMFRAAQRELDAVDTFLRQNDLPRFHRRRILGIEAPETFAKYLRFREGFPFRPEIKIGAPRQIIARLGGEQLYGSERNPPLRELLMNARDAIVVRRCVDRGFTGGRILVRFEHDGGDVIMSVADDGIGMDKYTLSEILLDFGNSYWKRDPRLEAPSVGMYGIGFFSVFMWSDILEVVSRRPGDLSPNALLFTNGLHGRPEVREGAEMTDSYSTIVRLRLRTEDYLKELCDRPLGQVELYAGTNLMWVVYGLLPITDIHTTIDCFGQVREVPPTRLEDLSGYALQHRLRFDSRVSRTVGEPSHRPFVVFSQKVVDEQGRAIGLGWPAHVGDGAGALRSAVTVQGFPTASHIPDFAGVIEGMSKSASRSEYQHVATDGQLVDWFRRCQEIMVKCGHSTDYIWGRWAFRLGLHPLNAAFISHFDRDHDTATELSLPGALEIGVQYLQVERSSRFFRFFDFYRRAKFAYLEHLKDLITLESLAHWLESIHGQEWHFMVGEILVPLDEEDGEFVFERETDRGSITRQKEAVIEVRRRFGNSVPQIQTSTDIA
jgi:hypothetical protein